MKAPACFNIWTQLFDPSRFGRCANIDPIEALKANTAGITITSVSGTPIGGTRSADKTFTRSSGVWIKNVIVDISGTSGTFQVGETVTETTSSATGVIVEVTATRMYLNTITAEFSGAKTLTGGTSGATATGGTATNVLENLTGKLIWSHASGVTTAGNWCKIVSNTKAALTLEQNLHSTGTAIILVNTEEAARDAMNISYGS